MSKKNKVSILLRKLLLMYYLIYFFTTSYFTILLNKCTIKYHKTSEYKDSTHLKRNYNEIFFF